MAEQMQVTFRHMSASDSLRELVDDKVQKVIARFPQASDFHIVVDCAAPAKRRKGNTCLIRIEMTLAQDTGRIGTEVSHQDPYAGVREAFQHLVRQIEHRADRKVS